MNIINDYRDKSAPRVYLITRDGDTIGTTLTLPDAIHFLHTRQSQSYAWAIAHEGYDIVTPDGIRLSDTQEIADYREVR